MEDTKCPLCGASRKMYWHKITPGLVRALTKTCARVVEKRQNVVSKHELQLGHSEYGNFQKLRFHGLIEKKFTNGEWKRGEWKITPKGFNFLRGIVAIPEKVLTFRNKVESVSQNVVTIHDVMKGVEQFEQYFDFKLKNLEEII